MPLGSDVDVDVLRAQAAPAEDKAPLEELIAKLKELEAASLDPKRSL